MLHNKRFQFRKLMRVNQRLKALEELRPNLIPRHVPFKSLSSRGGLWKPSNSVRGGRKEGDSRILPPRAPSRDLGSLGIGATIRCWVPCTSSLGDDAPVDCLQYHTLVKRRLCGARARWSPYPARPHPSKRAPEASPTLALPHPRHVMCKYLVFDLAHLLCMNYHNNHVVLWWISLFLLLCFTCHFSFLHF
jgi:hypothetical protein